MSRKAKLSQEQIIEIMETPAPDNIFERGDFYKNLGKKYGVGTSVIKTIKYIKNDYNDANPASEAYWRLTLKKTVTKEKAIQVISEMFLELTGKLPEQIKLIDRYSTVQVYIEPEKLIFQFDEVHMCDFNKFVITVSHALRQCYQDYLNRTNVK